VPHAAVGVSRRPRRRADSKRDEAPRSGFGEIAPHTIDIADRRFTVRHTSGDESPVLGWLS
ncbi:hypothetical protein, partial [Burkholderia multivorans]|uniref:hypothetical protein n=1 Tax=Burkholderia multivorans TaxID=87883 RepID=UPI001C6570A0